MLRRRLLIPALAIAGLVLPGAAQANFIADTVIDSGPPTVGTDATPSFTFHGDSGFTFLMCQIDGGQAWHCGGSLDQAEPPTGSWTAPAPLADGAHLFKAWSCGEEDLGHGQPELVCETSTAQHGFAIDTTGPSISWLNGSTPDGARVKTASYQVEGGYVFANGSPYACRLDGVAFACIDKIALDGAAIADGAHELEVRAVDELGNWGPWSSRRFTRDTTAPAVAFQVDALTNDSTPTLRWTAPHDGGDPYTSQCKLDGAAVPCAFGAYTPAQPLADGAHKLEVLATDGLGNSSSFKSASFTVDTAAPDIATLVWDEPAKRVRFTVTGADRVECAIDAGPFAPCAGFVDLADLAAGRHTVTVRASDAAGNTDTATQDVTIVAEPGGETTPPPGGGGAAPVAGPGAGTPVAVATHASTAKTTARKAAKKRKTCAKAKKRKGRARASAKARTCKAKPRKRKRSRR